MQVLRSEAPASEHLRPIGPGFQDLVGPGASRRQSQIRARRCLLQYIRNNHSLDEGDIAKQVRLYQVQNLDLPE